MPASPAVEGLRLRISSLEDTQRRFSRTISVADAIDRSLPHGGLPAGCIHEVKGTTLAIALAFSAILSVRLSGEAGHILYISSDCSLYPLGLLPYGVKLDQVLQVSARRRQDVAWAVMEALRCSQVGAVIALLDGLDLTECRRLQLAAEGSGVTGFFLGHVASAPMASAITRWRVSSVSGRSNDRFESPLWDVDLLYCRGGSPGKWIVEWRDRKLSAIPAEPVQLAVASEALG